jgi:GNAT superfamily N-acetyltransferase
MDIEIRIFEPTCDKKEFYGYMGDALTMPEIKKELPYLTNSRAAVWFLAFSSEELIGFASVIPTKQSVTLNHHYVFPAHRRQGIFIQLLTKSLAYTSKLKLPINVAVACKFLLPVYNDLGFKETRQTKNYVFMRREI